MNNVNVCLHPKQNHRVLATKKETELATSVEGKNLKLILSRRRTIADLTAGENFPGNRLTTPEHARQSATELEVYV